MSADRAGALRTAAIVLGAAVVIALVRGPLFDAHKHARETTDVYTLPPPRELTALSLGYRSALADLLWAHVLVSQGLHTEQHRRYGNLIPFLDAINTLEPTYGAPYRFAESLITFQSKTTPVEEVRTARAILERGLANRPLDADLWLEAGEFVAFVAPRPTSRTRRSRRSGRRTAPGCSSARRSGGDNANIAWQAIGAARLLGKAGERDAQIRFLTRTLAVTDDAELQDKIKAQLAILTRDERQEERQEATMREQEENLRMATALKAVKARDIPQIKRSEYVLLGPPRDPAYCAGEAHEQELACAPTWHAWEERFKESSSTKETP